MKLIKINNIDHYIVVDDSEIKEGDWYENNGVIFRADNKFDEGNNPNQNEKNKKITHSTQPLGKPLFFTNGFESELSLSINGLNDTVIENWGCKKLFLSEVEEAINGYSTYELFKKVGGTCEKGEYEHWLFEQSFNAHKELVMVEIKKQKMESLFCPYQESLELKELGFDEPCFGYFNTTSYLGIGSFVFKQCDKNITDGYGNKPLLRPTFSQAFRWFRENHNIPSHITYHMAT
jgi:hypothetical protein